MSPEKPATSEKPATFASYLCGSPTKNLGKTRDAHAYLRVFTPRPRKQIRDFRLLPPRFLFETSRGNPRPSRLAMRFYSANSEKNPRYLPRTPAFPLENTTEKPATFTLSYMFLLRNIGENSATTGEELATFPFKTAHTKSKLAAFLSKNKNNRRKT